MFKEFYFVSIYIESGGSDKEPIQLSKLPYVGYIHTLILELITKLNHHRNI